MVGNQITESAEHQIIDDVENHTNDSAANQMDENQGGFQQPIGATQQPPVVNNPDLQSTTGNQQLGSDIHGNQKHAMEDLGNQQLARDLNGNQNLSLGGEQSIILYN
ncbi:hypothetical protein ACH5RR_018304 [Cinchona calisaya]|uniref:Uncharacterized protein n=1 Tax=Cinchona calisaya TaxID=153742 RepID=A0ABD2ZPP0_9GENT